MMASFALPAFAEEPTQPVGTPVVNMGTQSMHVSAVASIAPVSRDSFSVTNPAPQPVELTADSAAVSRYVTVNPPAAAYSGDAVISYAQQFVGVVPYGDGNDPTDSFSCDGLVQYVLAGFGLNMPRGVTAQAGRAITIAPSDARAGDLLVWEGHHIGFYDGNGGMIDSPSMGRYVLHRSSIWGNPTYMRIII